MDADTLAKLRSSIKEMGGLTVLAEEMSKIGKYVYPQLLEAWIRRGQIPAVWVLSMEQALKGAVTRHELRPDVYGEKQSESSDDPF